MHRDIIVICSALLAIVISSFAGSAMAIYTIKAEMDVEMAALRAQVEPSVCRLFSSGGYRP